MSQLSWEKSYPLVLSLLTSAAILLVQFLGFFDFSSLLVNDFLSASVSLGSIWAGFVGAMMGIMLTLPRNGIIRSLIESGYMTDLHFYMQRSIQSSVVFAIVSLIGILFRTQESYFFYYFVLWSGILVYAAACFWRMATIMQKVMEFAHRSKSDD